MYVLVLINSRLKESAGYIGMFNHNDMSGKLIFISRMRILLGILFGIEVLAVGWIAAFNFLYPSQDTANLAVSWLILLGLIMPADWLGVIICTLLSMVVNTDALIILTSGIYIIIALMVNRWVWIPNPSSYRWLVQMMRLEIIKSILLMMTGCFISLVNMAGQEMAVYMAIAAYEFGSVVNIVIFYKLLGIIDRMDYREIFQTDGKKPYGQ